MKTLIKLFLFPLVAVVLAGCAEQLSDLDTAFGKVAEQYTSVDRVTGQREVNQYNRTQQIAKADEEARSLILEISSRGTKMGVNADRKQYARLQRVFRQVHSVSHFHNENWTPILIGDGQWNAFVNGGTYVFVHWGLMRDLSDDAELAAVIAHEIAHIAANHRFEQQSHVQIANLLGSKSAGREHWEAAFTHEQEEEADKIGVLYMALAGYDPQAAVRVWEEKFAKHGDGNLLIRTHPVPSSRMQKARQVAQQVRQYYSPGVKNYKFAEVLRNNVLWNTDNKSNLAVGKGGGFFSVLEGVASGLAKHNQAKAEEKRQQYEFEQNKPGIRWTMRDSCNDGQRIQYRFFARQNNQKKGVWPSNNKVYWTSGSETATLTLPCYSDYNRICYGAESNGTSWGLGIRGNKGCSNCCVSCPQYGKTERVVNMTCP